MEKGVIELTIVRHYFEFRQRYSYFHSINDFLTLVSSSTHHISVLMHEGFFLQMRFQFSWALDMVFFLNKRDCVHSKPAQFFWKNASNSTGDPGPKGECILILIEFGCNLTTSQGLWKFGCLGQLHQKAQYFVALEMWSNDVQIR